MIKKGKKLKSKQEWQHSVYRGIKRAFPNRHNSKLEWEKAQFYISHCMSERREYEAHMANLPNRFSKAYNQVAYSIDLNNIDLYYTKWEREDQWKAKASLRRVRQFEKREHLKPFEDLREDRRRGVQMVRDQERERQYYLASQKP